MEETNTATTIDPQKFGMGVRVARINAGFSQAELGELASLTQNRVSVVERGNEGVPWTDVDDTVRTLCDALDLSVESLIALAESAPPPESAAAPVRVRKPPRNKPGKPYLVKSPKFEGTPPVEPPPPEPPPPPGAVRPFDGFRPGTEEYRLLCKLVDGAIGVDDAARRLREIVNGKIKG